MKTTGIKGLLRDEDGACASGFVGNVAYADTTLTELRAIVKAMEWSWRRGVRNLEIQSDAREAISWIREKANLQGVARELVHDAIRWCDKDWNIFLRAIFCEQNRSGDALAMIGTILTAEWMVFASCPPECEEVYANDLVQLCRFVELERPASRSCRPSTPLEEAVLSGMIRQKIFV
ncbi:uncharacterized protein LOC116004900 [Ipomoea triloba]|uniref:uncharacterized protein LOC116004900 n=1 Tax=Ipomoea triloba TaxID=35885 RepID=UPI00125D48C5|nr:uncharacterized protein LOC116004900 [Ipomoea triloba]